MKKIYLIILSVLAFFPVAVLAQGYYYDTDGYGMMSGAWGFGGMMGYGIMFFSLVFWVLIIFGLIYLVKWLAGQGKNEKSEHRRAEEILKERYAKGEIDKKEFEEKIKEIKSV